MVKRLAALVVATVIASGCAAAMREMYEKKLNTWVQADVNALLASWGPPSEQFTMPNGVTMYTYAWSAVGPTVVAPVGFGPRPPIVATTATAWCRTTFLIQHSRVVSWQFQGTNCR